MKNFISLKNFIEANVKATKAFEDNKTLVYQVLKEDKGKYPYFLRLEDSGWSDITKDKNNNITRWAKNNTELKLVNLSKQKQNFYLEFDLKSEEELRKLDILLNDKIINSYIVLPKENKITLNLEDIEPGTNSLKFQLSDQSDKVIDKESTESGVLVRDINYSLIDSSINSKSSDLALSFDKENSKLLQIPAYIDNKNTIEGYNDARVLKYQNFMKENNLWGNNLPLIKELFFAEKIKEKDDLPYDILNEDYYYETISQVTKYYDIENVVLNKDYINENNLEKYKEFIEENLIINNKQEIDQHIIYKVGDIKEIKPIISIQDNWKFLYKSNPNFQTREIFNNASLALINPDSEERDIKFTFKAFSCQKSEPRTLEIYLNDSIVKTISLERKHNVYEIILPKVKQGDNNVFLKLYDKNGQYIDTENDRNVCTAKFTNMKAEFN